MARADVRQRQRLDPDERRAAILAAATQEFAARPFEQVAMASVAATADASEALVYRYFASKADLYAAVVERSLDDLLARQVAAQAALHPRSPAREKVKAALGVFLDTVSAEPAIWAARLTGGSDPGPAMQVRKRARQASVRQLASILLPDQGPRHDFALWGYFGFLDQACLHWVERGCPEQERWTVINAALGALEGALGDWGC